MLADPDLLKPIRILEVAEDCATLDDRPKIDDAGIAVVPLDLQHTVNDGFNGDDSRDFTHRPAGSKSGGSPLGCHSIGFQNIGQTLYINPGKELRRWDRVPTAMLGGGAEMVVYDVNGDGRNDIVTSLGGHGFGPAWFEQTRPSTGGGEISFVEKKSWATTARRIPATSRSRSSTG